jgi:hypothetical protein
VALSKNSRSGRDGTPLLLTKAAIGVRRFT